MQKNPFGWNTLAIEPTPKRSQRSIRNEKYHEEPEKLNIETTILHETFNPRDFLPLISPHRVTLESNVKVLRM